MAVKIDRYNLSGSGLVDVIKVFGDEYYIALVEMEGRYPEEGKKARDIKRAEYIHIIEGEFKVKINDKETTLKNNEGILINDGDVYEITGKGRSLVFVHDDKGGESRIEDL